MRTGVGPGQGSYLSIGLMVLLAALLLPLAFAPLVAVGLALTVLAIRQHNLHLGVWAVVFGVLGGLETFYVISNLLDRIGAGFYREAGGYSYDSSNVAILCMALLLMAGGLTALKRERGR